MIIFKLQAAESNDEVDIYTVTITNSKATVFRLVHNYVVCGTTFWMTANLIGDYYYVLTNPLMRSCVDNLVDIHIYVQCEKISADFGSTLTFVDILYCC